jgi:DnaJ-class molecular chaperone
MNNFSKELQEEINNFDFEAIFSDENIAKMNIEVVKEKEEIKIEESRYKKCGKCNGKGKIDHYHYVSGGVCFSCDGAGKIYK